MPGSWLFRIGPLDFEDSIEEPDYISSNEHISDVLSCETSGKYKCHSSAKCTDTGRGFCCTCNSGYYGNGESCLKNDVPIRVSGKVSGSVNNETISSQLQSYVVMIDGRSYTAISPLTPTVGYSLQLAQVLGGVVGWLFAKPGANVKNGYEVHDNVHCACVFYYYSGNNVTVGTNWRLYIFPSRKFKTIVFYIIQNFKIEPLKSFR